MSELYKTAVNYGMFVCALSILELLLTEDHSDIDELRMAQSSLVHWARDCMAKEPAIFKEFRDRTDAALAFAEQNCGIPDPLRLYGDDDTPARIVPWSYYHAKHENN